MRWRSGRLLNLRKKRQIKLSKMWRKSVSRNLKIQRRISATFAAGVGRTCFIAGGPQAGPTDEVIKFVNDLLSKLAFKPYRDTLKLHNPRKMPALILYKQSWW